MTRFTPIRLEDAKRFTSPDQSPDRASLTLAITTTLCFCISAVFAAKPATALVVTAEVEKIQLGTQASATGVSTAIGHLAEAESSSKDLDSASIAIGNLATAGSKSVSRATALGASSYATGRDSVALGGDSNARNDYAIGIGSGSNAKGKYAIGIGANAEVNGTDAIAIGRQTYANGLNAVTIGMGSAAGGEEAIALGPEAKGAGAGAVAIGSEVLATGESSIAIGARASASAKRSVAIGADSKATRADSVDLGNRVITSISQGSADTDAANVRQLRGVATALGGGASVDATGAIVAPSYLIGNKTHASVGSALSNLDGRVNTQADSIEALNEAMKTATGNITSHAIAYDDDKHAIVSFSGTSGTRLTNVAAGSLNKGSTDAVNGGQISTLTSNFDAKISGLDLRVKGLEQGGISTGGGSTGSGGGNIGTGGGNTDSGGGSIGTGGGNIGSGSGSSGSGETNIGSGGGNTDDGSGGSALVRSSVVDGPDGATSIGVGSELPSGHALSVGAPGRERTVTNLATGVAGTDGVNLNQLNASRDSAVQQANRHTELRFQQSEARLDDVSRTAYSGVAMAMAMPNISPAKAGSTVVAAGSAAFQSYTALGLGATYRSPNGQMLINGAFAYSNSGGTAARVQVGYEF